MLLLCHTVKPLKKKQMSEPPRSDMAEIMKEQSSETLINRLRSGGYTLQSIVVVLTSIDIWMFVIRFLPVE